MKCTAGFFGIPLFRCAQILPKLHIFFIVFRPLLYYNESIEIQKQGVKTISAKPQYKRHPLPV